MQRLANAEVVGPILMGMRKPVHILNRGSEVKDIVNLARSPWSRPGNAWTREAGNTALRPCPLPPTP